MYWRSSLTRLGCFLSAPFPINGYDSCLMQTKSCKILFLKNIRIVSSDLEICYSFHANTAIKCCKR